MTSARAAVSQIVLLAGAYLGAARIGLDLPVADGVITPVWIPTGIALAALLLFGYRLWPGVAIGAFAANAIDLPVDTAAGIAMGNTLEAVVATYLLRRIGFDTALERTRDVLAFGLVGAVIATGIAATNGVAFLYLAGIRSDAEIASAWLLWWFGDLIGALLVAPALMVWHHQWRARNRFNVVEAVVLTLGIGAAAAVVFLEGRWQYPYILFPLLIWAAMRFRPLGAATAVLIIGVIGTIGTLGGSVPIGGATETQSVQILQGLIAMVGFGALMMAASVTERETAKRELDEAHASLAEAQSIAHFGSWSWDIPANVVTWSDEMYRIYGYEAQQFPITFEKAMERVPDDDAARVQAMLEREFKVGKDHKNPDIEYRVVLPDGTERMLVGKGALYFNSEGEPIRLVGTVQDVTEAVKAQEEMSEAFLRERDTADRLRELDHIKNTFMSAVSHDLRSPLTTITALSDVIVKRIGELPKEELIDALSRISGSAARANRVLTNILDVDRLSRGGIEAARGEVDLADLCARVAYGIEADGHQIALPDESVRAWVDEGLVERIIENLLYNAVRHSGSRKTVEVRFEEGPDGVVLIVEDTGKGVPDELKEVIFEAFHRGNATVSGTGVGLFLVAQFAELHGGRAWVEDRQGGGASFRVFFPAHSEQERSETS